MAGQAKLRNISDLIDKNDSNSEIDEEKQETGGNILIAQLDEENKISNPNSPIENEKIM